MKRSAFLALSVFLMSALSASAGTYTVDTVHSSVGFSIRHLVSQVKGNFKEFDGTFTFDEKKPEASTGKFVIKAKSIDTDNEKRDEHLRGEDFFHVDKYPEITFVVKKFRKGGGKGKFKMDGDLTLRGVTKPVTWDVEYNGSTEFMGSQRLGFNATTKVNRKDYGVNWNKALDKGGFVLGDEVTMSLAVEAAESAKDEKKAAEAESKSVKK